MSDPRIDAMARAGAAMSSVAASGWRWLPLSAVIIVLDQLTKLWVVRSFEYGESLAVLPVLDITLLYNTGAAFSFLAQASGWQRWFFVALALLVSAGILFWLRKLHGREHRLLGGALSLVLAGAIGNVVDRLRLGHVVDFIHAHWNEAYFPAFNVADSAITIGAGLMLLDAWLEGRRGGRG